MKKSIRVETNEELYSYIPDVTYANVPAWYGCTIAPMKMSIIKPKVGNIGKPRPVIIWLCGGAFSVMDKDVWMPQMMYFVKRGYTAVGVQYRTSNEAVFPAPLEDIKSAVRFIRAHSEQLHVDGNNIFIGGESAGGTLASLMGLTQGKYNRGDYTEQSDSVQGVADFYGAADLRSEEWDFSIEGMNCIKCVNSDAAPFVIIHGDRDSLVGIEQSDGLYEALTAAGADTEYYVIEGAGHGADACYQSEVLSLVDEFFKKHMR